jgi:hypothetical protein
MLTATAGGAATLWYRPESCRQPSGRRIQGTPRALRRSAQVILPHSPVLGSGCWLDLVEMFFGE